MPHRRCLLIADDLTGGADAGAQFAKKNLRTLLISPKANKRISFKNYVSQEINVLAINTDSRGKSPDEAYQLILDLLTEYEEELFPILYKKIDSTLRGNIGSEIDAILEKTKNPLCFVAPSYPEQNRTLVGGIMIVGEKPLAMTEVARRTAVPIQESHVYKILQNQSKNRIGWIDLTHVATSPEGLKRAVETEVHKGNRIIIFDAVSRQDLKNITEVGFLLEKKPLFVGSAGLAEEVAQQLSLPRKEPLPKKIKIFQNIFLISGTASSVTHQQLDRLTKRGIPSYELPLQLILDDWSKTKEEREETIEKISKSLSSGVCIFRSPREMLNPKESTNRITKILATVALEALKKSRIQPMTLALFLTGGETAQHMINVLEPQEIEIEGELLEGIVRGHLVGGDWNGMTIVTKAGAFGKEDALERTLEMLTHPSPERVKEKNK